MGQARPSPHGSGSSPVRMQDTVTVVETAAIGVPVTPPIVVAVTVVSRADSDYDAETVAVMFAFVLPRLHLLRGEGK